MNLRSPVAVLCPGCNELLYETVPEGTSQIVVHRGRNTNPPIARDERGHFMKCPHCARRIAFQKVLNRENTATSFELMPVQDSH